MVNLALGLDELQLSKVTGVSTSKHPADMLCMMLSCMLFLHVPAHKEFAGRYILAVVDS